LTENVFLPIVEHKSTQIFFKTMINALTGLRFLAAVWIVLFHMSCVNFLDYNMGWGNMVNWGSLAYFLQWGSHAVEVFFVLSGFLMSLAHRQQFIEKIEPSQYFRFIALRLSRIYPLHLVLLLYLVAAIALGWIEQRSPFNDGIGWQLTLTQAWLPASSYNDLTWNLPAWAVSTQWAAYLLFPFFIWLIARVRWTKPRLSVAMALLVALYYVRFEGGIVAWHLGEMALTRTFICFALGMLMHEAYRLGWAVQLKWEHACFFLCFMVAAYCMEPQASKVMILVTAALVIFGLARSTGGIARVLSSRVFVYLGSLSYAIYLLQYPVMLTISRTAKPTCQWLATQASPSMRMLAALAVLVLIVLLAIPLYHCVEKPMRDAVRKLLIKQPVNKEPDSSRRNKVRKPAMK